MKRTQYFKPGDTNMAAHPLMNKIVDAGIALAYSGQGAGIAGVWAEFLRQHIKIVSGPTAKFQTWAVDGRAVWVNAEFTQGLTSGELQFIIAHETMHIALDHVERARSIGAHTPEQKHTLNIAEDAIINQALIDDGIGIMPTGEKAGVTLAQFISKGYPGERDSMILYEWLMENQKHCPKPPPAGEGEGETGEGEGALQGCSPSGTPGDEPAPSEGSQGEREGEGQGEGEGEGQTPGAPGNAPSESQRMKSKLRVERARATLKEASQKAGSGTAIAELLAPRATRASVKQVIRRGFEQASVSALNRQLPTYSRAGRRSVDNLLPTPGKMGTEAWVAFAADVSGSMSDEGKAALIGFIGQTAREFPDVRVFLVSHTDEVVWEGWLAQGGDVKKAQAAAAFSGGTSFAPAYDAVRKARAKRFDVLVHFTDGYNGADWPECPARQLVVGLWGSGSGMTTPPLGAQVVPVAAIDGDL
ncbi:MAG: hypothetical protein WAV09_03170 [Minisyncoccia bacterium]